MPSQINTFVDMLRHRAEVQADELLFTFLRGGVDEEGNLSYRDLDRRARQIARAIRQTAPEGARVLILHSPGLEYIASLYGCFYAKVVAVPIYPPRFNSKLDRLVTISKSAEATLALTSTAILEGMHSVLEETPALSGMKWLETDRLADAESELDIAPPQPNDLALIQYTSGSTSEPKGVMLSHANLVANVKCISANFALSPQSRSVLWLPPYHDMGLIGGLLPPVWIGFPMVLMSPFSFVQRPLRWLSAMSKYRATASGAPNFAYDLCTQRISDEQLKELDLSHWEVAFCGAEPIRAKVLDAFAERFKAAGFRKEALHPCYGLAESTLIASGVQVAAPPVVVTLDPEKLETEGVVSLSGSEQSDKPLRAVVGCGNPMPDHRIAIVDPVRRVEVADGNVGEIWLAGPSIARGYWNKREDTSATFEATLEDDPDAGNFLRTGDLGFRLNNELFVTGRQKDLLIIRGRNFYPQDIEFSATCSHEALGASNAAALMIVREEEEKLVLLQEVTREVTDDDLDGIIRDIRKRIFEDHGVMPYAVSIVRRNSLPLTSSGKIQRFLCRKLFLEGQLRERKTFLEA